MKVLYIVAVFSTVAVAVNARAGRATIYEEHPIDWYDCSGKADGNYPHPSDCTRFISCSGGIASQRDCANCNPVTHPNGCVDGRTVYNATVGDCLWAYETECVIGETTDGPSTTEGPTDGPTDGPTEGPTEGPTDAPPSEGEEGDDCDPELCRNNGYCQSYLRCDNGTLVREECDEGLVWNPLNPDGTDHIHGGNCDTWESLRPEIEEEYRKDPECLACFWKSTGECEREYLYQAPALRHRNVLTLSCNAGLVFSEEKETCRRCQDVVKADGNPCCAA